jgi:hypothetical protein
MNKVLNISPRGPSLSVLTIQGANLEVYTYSPRKAISTGLLFLFDGVNRDAIGIRDKAIALAERFNLTLIAPSMDKVTFPKWRYHYAGVVRNHVLQPQRVWTATIIQQLIDMMLERYQRHAQKIYLFGHSAGAQMISRVCAYSPLSDVDMVIVSNPSSYVMPLLDEPAPYGFKSVYSENRTLPMLKTYLTAPLTIYLGKEDTKDLHLSRSKYAMRQGKNRLERGRCMFQTGEKIARKLALEFNWRLIEIPGVGHSSREMLNVDNFTRVLVFRPNMKTIT